MVKIKYSYIKYEFNRPNQLTKWLEWLGILTLIVGGATFIFSFLPSFFSYRGLVYEKETYYIGLKKDIKKSNNYHEFIMLTNKRNEYNTK